MLSYTSVGRSTAAAVQDQHGQSFGTMFSPLMFVFVGGFVMGRLYTILMLLCSNLFMTYAWYGHLKDLKSKPIYIAIVASWGVAFLEYCLQVPANRIGFQYFTLCQLKVIQEIVTICIFALFAFFYMKERLSLDILWAGLCLVAAAYFMFRGVPTGA